MCILKIRMLSYLYQVFSFQQTMETAVYKNQVKFIIFMQQAEDYFYLQQFEGVKGICKEFVSQSELKWRDADRLQSQPFKRVAKHIRNIQYTPQNTRTLQTLKKALDYLIQSIFPLMFKPNKLGISTERVALFLEERLIAIRCQYFVQGIIFPEQLLKLMRCLVVVWMMKGISTKSYEMVGLQFLVQMQSKKIMQTRFPTHYYEALKYSIFATKSQELIKLLSIHNIILEDDELSRLLALRLKFQRHNYEAYFASLSQEDSILRCLIWLKNEDMKVTMKSIVKKAFGDVRTSWLFKRLCLLNDRQEKWIPAKSIGELDEGKDLGFQEWISLSVLQQVLK